ncbi:Ribulosamine/erythrulosamine 3-kinase potentially involved in protein deglycation [hydrothermal vent metagenome]|uniref:Ribulosamine/erythrulosamine 3-kinase potentially involved in protein deglycation n=1 Tax=hydrothermal vent metagenome TaxID=652676 RepID=A0A1W1C0Q9_9ZZZZ
MEHLQAELSQCLNQEICSIDFFSQGQIGDIYKVNTANNTYILKTSQPSDRLQIEADMLMDIKKYKIAVPEVYASSETYLLMDLIEEQSIGTEAEALAAARVLKDLHSVTNESRMYGYYYDTTIASFVQKNEQTQYNWGLFLGQMRIMPMAQVCYDKGQISHETVSRLERLCRDLYKRIDMSKITPSLLHGDLWQGNILFNMNSATLIDPALYFGDREIELAFIVMFHTFGKRFFDAYNEVHPLSNDFYETKVPLYQIYPLLVHTALYGSTYRGELEQVLKRLKV